MTVKIQREEYRERLEREFVSAIRGYDFALMREKLANLYVLTSQDIALLESFMGENKILLGVLDPTESAYRCLEEQQLVAEKHVRAEKRKVQSYIMLAQAFNKCQKNTKLLEFPSGAFVNSRFN